MSQRKQEQPTPASPLAAAYDGDPTDTALAEAAVAGDRAALEALVRRHQGFVYSLAQRMLYRPEDARDATQEILVRIVTHLGSFRGEAAFRTWAYRIAVRHLLALKRAGIEEVVHDFGCFGRALDATPDQELPDEGSLPVDVQLVVEESKVGCLMAMLICLDRDHRMAFVLGEIFEASDAVMADVLGVSRENARQRLTRARQQLREFLTGRCGLLDPGGSCRCARKTRGFIEQGIVDPTRLCFTDVHLERARTASIEGARALEGHVVETYAALLRAQPAGGSEFARILRDVLEQPAVRRTLELQS